MRLVPLIVLLVIDLQIYAQFNNMDAAMISEKNIEMIKASYVEKEQEPAYQIFYKFDTLGRVIQSVTSDDIETTYRYFDSLNICVKTRINRDVGNKIITYTKGWQNLMVKIYNTEGDSIVHRLYYDTISIDNKRVIECFDVIITEGDTAFHQLFDLSGNMLRYEVYGSGGEVLAYYDYTYENGKLVYTEFYEGDRFVYKEKIAYYPDSNIRMKRVSVPGDGMFSDRENSYTTEYFRSSEGLLIQEADYLGEKMTSVTIYTYQYYDPEKNKRPRNGH